jgi:hypothetical protein
MVVHDIDFSTRRIVLKNTNKSIGYLPFTVLVLFFGLLTGCATSYGPIPADQVGFLEGSRLRPIEM